MLALPGTYHFRQILCVSLGLERWPYWLLSPLLWQKKYLQIVEQFTEEESGLSFEDAHVREGRGGHGKAAGGTLRVTCQGRHGGSGRRRGGKCWCSAHSLAI